MSHSDIQADRQASTNPLHTTLVVCLLPGPVAPKADGWLERDAALLDKVYQLKTCCGSRPDGLDYDVLSFEVNDLSQYLQAIEQAHGAAMVLLLREDIELPEHWLARLLAVSGEDVGVVSCLGNFTARFNPLDLDASESSDAEIYLAAEDHWFSVASWPQGLALIHPDAIAGLIKNNSRYADAADDISLEGLQIAICSNLYAHTPSPVVKSKQLPLAALGQLRQNLQTIKQAETANLPLPGLDSLPVLLHLSHNWGGGIDRWIRDFCNIDQQHHHFILEACAAADADKKNLLLWFVHAGKKIQLNSWCLQPTIEDTAIAHKQYTEIIGQLISRFQIDQLLISSLIGHSLDAFTTDIPILQITHDYYPLWPFLTSDPAPYFDLNGTLDFAHAWDELQARPETTLLGEHGLSYWSCLRESYLALLQKTQTQQIAPSQAAAEMMQALSENPHASIKVIPHGIDAGALATVEATGGEKLRLLVPGRIHAGKGKQLLLDALPELTKIADIYLLGSGQDGEDFFGISGVNVIYQYLPEALYDEVTQIAPDVALLLSTVPETWSYTLSEMSAMGIPVVATRMGAFVERLEQNPAGWLIDPTAENLLERLKQLHEQPDLLSRARKQLATQQALSPESMLKQYQSVLVASHDSDIVAAMPELSLAALQLDFQSQANLSQQAKLTQLLEKLEAFKTSLAERAQWAEGLNAELDSTGRTLSAKIEELSLMETETGAEIERLNHELIERTDWATSEIGKLTTTVMEWEDLHRQKDETLNQILGSRSWKLTKPLRATSRLGRNFMDMKAYNPARWPYILKRIRQSMAVRGMKGTLQRAQHHQEAAPQPDTARSIKPIQALKKILDPAENQPLKPVSFKPVKQPLVSIIIPLYNQFAYTQACLQSLKQVSNNTPFEIILVDDGSSDKTPELLAACVGVTALRNTENLGFIGSCNHGAEKALGKYLLFLNNDTEVTDRWLDNLIAAFTEFPEAGIVGSRLVYPDGKLQESGGIIFSDASGWNYGRNGNADDPRYQFAREVDYVSGAALMISSDLFNRFGGFDSHYAPAYYEDTDLAFKCRQAGYKVFVQPRSTVIHYEGITSGTDLSQGMKKYQLVNHKKFKQRWAGELSQQPTPIVDPQDTATIRAAAEHYTEKRILIIDACTPRADQDSGSVRMLNMMRIFRDLGYQVTFFPDNRQWDGKYSEIIQAMGVEVLYGEWIKNLPEFFSQRGKDFDLLLVSRYYVAENYLKLAGKYMPQAKLIFDTVDLHYLREQRQAELEQDTSLHRAAARSRRAELGIINAADTTIVVSPYEQSILSNDAPEARVDVVSNIHPVVGSRKPFAERQNIFFIGGYQHPPNVDSALWLAKKIWPIIHAELPGVNCFLLGSKAPSIVQKLDGNGIIFKGFVEDLEPWLDNCRIALAPLRYGAGVKGKVNMSMSYGQPVVASGIAVEGMYTENGREVLVADDAEEFAAQVIRLYQDEALWNTLSENSVKNVETHFSFSAARKNINNMIARINKTP